MTTLFLKSWESRCTSAVVDEQVYSDQRRRFYCTCVVSQYLSDAYHLCTEDADGNKELWDDAKGSPQVFRRQFAQIHGHNVG